MKCTEVMTKDPRCCLATDSVFEAAQLMKLQDVGPIPIVDHEQSRKLLGIVTDRDLALKVIAGGLDPKTTAVKDVMTKDVVTCRGGDNVDDAIKLMEKHQVRRIPIVDDDNRLVGIIAQADVATRMQPGKTAEVVKEISQAA